MKYKYKKKLIVYVITYEPKSSRSPLGHTAPLSKGCPLLIFFFFKNLAPRKYTTSNFSSPPNFRVFIHCLWQQQVLVKFHQKKILGYIQINYILFRLLPFLRETFKLKSFLQDERDVKQSLRIMAKFNFMCDMHAMVLVKLEIEKQHYSFLIKY